MVTLVDIRSFKNNRVSEILVLTRYKSAPSVQTIEQTFSYPLPFKIANIDGKAVVDFGQQDGINPGHILLNYNEHGERYLVII